VLDASKDKEFREEANRLAELPRDIQRKRCGTDLSLQPFHAHHIRRHADGGQTQLYNGMVLCVPCHEEVHYAFPGEKVGKRVF
jgi:hypothetical protein